MKPRVATIALVAALLLGAGCERENEQSAPVTARASTGPAQREADSTTEKLARLVKAHSAVTLPDVDVGSRGELTTLHYQDAMDRLRGQRVGFVAMISDVYRTESGYGAEFFLFTSGFDARIMLSVTEGNTSPVCKKF